MWTPGDEVATDLLLGSDGEAYSAAGGVSFA
jgi:hypothetical protein